MNTKAKAPEPTAPESDVLDLNLSQETLLRIAKLFVPAILTSQLSKTLDAATASAAPAPNAPPELEAEIDHLLGLDRYCHHNSKPNAIVVPNCGLLGQMSISDAQAAHFLAVLVYSHADALMRLTLEQKGGDPQNAADTILMAESVLYRDGVDYVIENVDDTITDAQVFASCASTVRSYDHLKELLRLKNLVRGKDGQPAAGAPATSPAPSPKVAA